MAVAALMSSFAVPAFAQSGDVVVMRRVVTKPTRQMTPSTVTPAPTPTPGSTPTPTPAPTGYYSWQVSPWHQEGACGSQGVQTRTVSCLTTDGGSAPDASCTGNGSGPKPASSQPVTVTDTCGYSWSPSAWSASAGMCGSYRQSRDLSCVRSDGTVVAPASCSNLSSRPDVSRVVDETSGCSFSWSASAWGAPSQGCGDGTQTRVVACQRSDGTSAEASSCVGEKPAETRTVHSTDSCTIAWKTGDFANPAPACGDTVSTRTVSCERSDGVAVDEAQCTGARPSTTQPSTDYSTCTDGRTADHPYGWTVGSYGAPSATCGTATETRSVVCTDNSGNAVADAMCVTGKPSTTTTTTETSGCTFSWSAGQFGSPQPACGATVQTRTISCQRSDGAAAPVNACTDQRPSSTQPATDYSACTYGWASGSWSELSSTCGDAVQTRSVYCQRADGTTESDQSKCTGAKPETTQTSHQTSGCAFTWSSGEYGTPAPACGASTQSRDVVCHRSDGQTVDDGECSAAGAKPAGTQPASDYSTCSFSWSAGAFSAPSSTCGTATQTRSVTCQRSDGTEATNAALCTAAKPAVSQASTQTSGCSYAWTASAYGSAVPACGPSTQGRSYSCLRSDGTTVDGSLCGTPAPTDITRPATDYSTCSFSWNVGLWQGGGACGISVQQNRTVNCLRSEGTSVSDSQCSSVGTKPAASQTITDYSACGYSWNVVYGAWSSTCSAAATRSNAVTCKRSDGVVVGDAYCTDTKPNVTDTQAITSSCSYTPSYSATYSACVSNTYGSTAGTQTAPISSCTRSDGTGVPVASCSPQTTTRSCTVPNTSDRYAREAQALSDPFNVYPNGQSTTFRALNVATNSVLKMVVETTQCWDSTASASSASTTCASLAAGPNVYDVVSLPATFVPDLHSVYVNQADLLAAAPHYSRINGGTLTAACGGSIIYVTSGGTTTSWSLYCGTPDTTGHYARTPSAIADPYNTYPSGQPQLRFQNQDFGASAFNFTVGSTSCWDTTANAFNYTGKCTYLTSGANAYDLVSIPATFQSELREVTVKQADLAATMPYSASGSVMGYSIATACSSGVNAYVGPSGNVQNWTLRCGNTADTPGHYQRGPGDLSDPFSYYSSPSLRYQNPSFTATSVNFTSNGTACWDSTANALNYSGKCTNLSSGTKQYDLTTIPATFVPDLREIYVSQTALAAALQHGTNVVGQPSVAALCAQSGGVNFIVGPNGGTQSWSLRCGTADNANHYQRGPGDLSDPFSYYSSPSLRFQNASFTATSFVFTANGTACWDSTANALNYGGKCTNLPTGTKQYDLFSVPATFVLDLREIYVSQGDLTTTLQHGSNILGQSGVTAFCAANGVGTTVGTSGNTQSWTVRCGTADTAGHYVRYAATYRDPFSNYVTSTTRAINNTTVPKLYVAATTISCWDKTTGKAATNSNKCTYLPSGPVNYDQISVPATWNTSTLKVTVNLSDLAAISPYTPVSGYNSTANVCGSGYTVGSGQGVAGNYTVVCQ